MIKRKAASCKLQATSYKLQATSYELQEILLFMMGSRTDEKNR